MYVFSKDRKEKKNTTKILFCSRKVRNTFTIIISITRYLSNSIKFVVFSLAVDEMQKQSNAPSATHFSKSGHAYLGPPELFQEEGVVVVAHSREV